MQPGGTITGVVTGDTGHKLSNVCIELASQTQAQTGLFFFGGSFAFTKTTGRSRPGTWILDYTPWTSAVFRLPELAPQWSMAQPAPAVLHPCCQPPRAGRFKINVTLPLGGTVTVPSGIRPGKPLTGICVLAIPAGSQYPTLAYPFGHGMSVTGGKGSYSVGDLAPGTDQLQFKTCGRPSSGVSGTGAGRPSRHRRRPTAGASRPDGSMPSWRLGGRSPASSSAAVHRPLACICVHQRRNIATESNGSRRRRTHRPLRDHGPEHGHLPGHLH